VVIRLAPQPGPQTDFLACGADVVLTGGGAGGGKSYSLLLDPLRYAVGSGCTPGWEGVLFRRHAKDLIGSGSLFEEARRLYVPTGAVMRAGEYMDARWPHPATGALEGGPILAFRHLDGANVLDYQGKQYAWIGIDEATHLDLSWILYLITRARTVCGTRAVVRMTCNPDSSHALREWVEPYLFQGGDLDGTADRSLSGVIRYFARSTSNDRLVWGATRGEAALLAGRDPSEVKSFAFIPSLYTDNLELLRMNPDYAASLSLHGRVTEEQLRRGNWHVRAETGGMLRRSRWGVVDKPLAPIVHRSRAWDKAATKPGERNRDPDFTFGTRFDWDIHGRFYVHSPAACRDEPPEVDRLMRATAALDGPTVTQIIEQDPGQAGKADALHTRRNLEASGRCGPIITTRPIADKVTKAQPLALALEQGMPGGEVWQPRGFILVGPWLEEPYADGGEAPRTLGDLLWSHVAPFPDGLHDDAADTLAIAYAAGVRAANAKPDRAARVSRAYS
jgi:phage terminase large subunit-like protein